MQIEAAEFRKWALTIRENAPCCCVYIPISQLGLGLKADIGYANAECRAIRNRNKPI
jgi:hypothetical protein